MGMLLCLLLYVGSLQGASVFDVGLWPGEGRPVFEAVATELPLRELPSRDARVTDHLRNVKGQPVEFGETVYRTLKPGQLRALAETRIAGRRLYDITRLSKEEYYRGKFPRTEVVVHPGDRVEFLQYRAEGTCFVRVEGTVIDAEDCPEQNAQSFAVESKPVLEWWIEVVADGRSRGWLLVDPSTVKQVRRTF